MEEEPGATCRYYCHMCSLIVRPELGVEVVTCPRCHSGFVEEMADAGRRSTSTEPGAEHAGARPEHAVPPWPPILMDLLGVSYGPDAGDAAAIGDLAALARRQYRQLAFLQLLNALRDDHADGNAPDSGLVLVSPTDAHTMLMSERGGSHGTGAAVRGPGLTLGELILGPGLDLLLEYLAETDPIRQGSLPAKKEAVAAMPTVKIAAAVTCPVCLDEFEAGGEAREMPCKHRFHEDCIVPWLEAHSSCPVCRYQLPTDEEVTATEPDGTGSGGDVEMAGAPGAGSAPDGGGDSDGGGSAGRRRWLARPFARLFARRSNGSSSSSST